jgi:hypothetical protein
VIKLNLVFFVILFSAKLYAQEPAGNKSAEDKKEVAAISEYKKLYKYADSVRQFGHAGSLDTAIYKVADSLDKLHPKEYFTMALQLMTGHKLNEASFIYLIGYVRYSYYNFSNPEYSSEDDGALATSLFSIVGEPMQMFLRSDIDNYISLLKKTFVWCSSHDYNFFSKNKAPDKYLKELTNLNNVITDLENNNEKYRKDWNDERIDMEKMFDSALEKNNDSLKKTGSPVH